MRLSVSLNKALKKKLAEAITSFHMLLIKTGMVSHVRNNWLLKYVPILMEWKPITLETPVAKELVDHEESKAV